MSIQVISPPANNEIPSGTIINGVAHFVEPTNPTTRIGGSPLIVDDKNYRTDLQVGTIWSGTYWVSATEYVSATGVDYSNKLTSSTSYVDVHLYDGIITHKKVLIVEAGISFRCDISPANHYEFGISLTYSNSDIFAEFAYADMTRITTGSTSYAARKPLNQYLDTEAPGNWLSQRNMLRLKYRRVGSPGAVGLCVGFVKYREVYL